MPPFSSQQDGEIILLELLPQFGHRIRAGFSSIRGQRCRCCIFEISPYLLLPLDLCLTQEIRELTGWPLPETRGSVGEICITAGSGSPFPCLALLAFELKRRIVGLGGVPDYGIPQFRQPAGRDIRQGGGINGAFVGQSDRLDEDRLNL